MDYVFIYNIIDNLTATLDEFLFVSMERMDEFPEKVLLTHFGTAFEFVAEQFYECNQYWINLK